MTTRILNQKEIKRNNSAGVGVFRFIGKEDTSGQDRLAPSDLSDSELKTIPPSLTEDFLTLVEHDPAHNYFTTTATSCDSDGKGQNRKEERLYFYQNNNPNHILVYSRPIRNEGVNPEFEGSLADYLPMDTMNFYETFGIVVVPSRNIRQIGNKKFEYKTEGAYLLNREFRKDSGFDPGIFPEVLDSSILNKLSKNGHVEMLPLPFKGQNKDLLYLVGNLALYAHKHEGWYQANTED